MPKTALLSVPVLAREPGAVLVALGQVLSFRARLEDGVLAAGDGRAEDERLVARAAFRRVRRDRAAAEHFEQVVDPTLHLFRRVHLIFESASETAFQQNRQINKISLKEVAGELQ
jgi:hypothetical protein